jgi:hypothetical protein
VERDFQLTVLGESRAQIKNENFFENFNNLNLPLIFQNRPNSRDTFKSRY